MYEEVFRKVEMKNLSDFFVGFLILCVIFGRGLCLQCWKCVSNDCAIDPKLSHNAVVARCKYGEQCMKVHYKMFDNITRYDTVIRTCAQNTCVTSSYNEFLKCVATPKLYMIGGCSLRLCCKDRDLCNSAPSSYMTSFGGILLLVVIIYKSNTEKCNFLQYY